MPVPNGAGCKAGQALPEVLHGFLVDALALGREISMVYHGIS